MSEQKKKEVLNIIVADNSKPKEYLDYLGIFYDVNVLNVDDVQDSKQVDALLFTGGADVNPGEYGQPIGKYTSINAERDALEIDTYYRFKNKPKIGICRGAQLLTVLAGGSLIQHVEGHGREHLIYIEHYGECLMPSTHHQMMYPFKMGKDKFKLLAWASKFQSTTYLDGENKEIETSSSFLEPEIVEYPNAKSLCIQGHPEMGNDDIKEVTLEMISKFIKQYTIKPITFNPRSYAKEESPYGHLKSYETPEREYDDQEEIVKENPYIQYSRDEMNQMIKRASESIAMRGVSLGTTLKGGQNVTRSSATLRGSGGGYTVRSVDNDFRNAVRSASVPISGSIVMPLDSWMDDIPNIAKSDLKTTSSEEEKSIEL